MSDIKVEFQDFEDGELTPHREEKEKDGAMSESEEIYNEIESYMEYGELIPKREEVAKVSSEPPLGSVPNEIEDIDIIIAKILGDAEADNELEKQNIVLGEQSCTPTKRRNDNDTAVVQKRSNNSQIAKMDSRAQAEHNVNMRFLSELPAFDLHQILTVKSEFGITNPTTQLNNEDFELLPVQYPVARNGFERIKLEDQSTAGDEVTQEAKREQAMQRAAAAIKLCNEAKEQKSTPPLTIFTHTDTVRKLPSSTDQPCYNSPLNRDNNVDFEFNSSNNCFDMHKWGLEPFPSSSAEIARILGVDADVLYKTSKSFKMPAVENTVNKPTEPFFKNVGTQTDVVTLLSDNNAYNIDGQPALNINCIGTQTSEDYIEILVNLTENQILALNEFAKLIQESADSPLHMCRLRERMIDIYNYAQLHKSMTPRPNKQNQPWPK